MNTAPNSLKMLNLFIEIAERTKCDLPIGDLFGIPTIAGLASVIRGVGADEEHKKVRRRTSADIRPAGPADIEPLCEFLHDGFTAGDMPPAAWRRLFTYKWLDQKPDFGRVLTVGAEIVGFLGAVYAWRKIGGKTSFVCNHTSWYVLPQYRGQAAELLADTVRNEQLTFTALTPAPAVTQMLEAMGFAILDRRKIALPPLFHLDTLRQQRPLISFNPEIVRRSLDDEHQRIFDDHAPYDCLQLSLSAGSDHAFLVVKRRRGGGTRLNRLFPANIKIAYSEILYCSNPCMLVRHLERVKQAIMRQQRTLLLICDERIFTERPKGLLFEAPTLYKSPTFDAAEVDKLYSELVLLPI